MKTKKVDKANETRIRELRKKLDGVTKERFRKLPAHEQVDLMNATVELDQLTGACNRATPIDVDSFKSKPLRGTS